MLCLTKYPERGPSSRYRVYQFLPHLRNAGIDVRIDTLHDDGYLERLFAGQRRSVGYLLRRGAGRLQSVLSARRFDLVFIQKEVLPGAPAVAEWALQRAGVRYVLDIDDAVFLPHHGLRGWGHHPRRKFATVLSHAALVLAGNRFLEQYARRYTPRVVMFPTVVDLDRYPPPAGQRSDPARPVVGWIGTPSTAPYLNHVAAVLSDLAGRHDFVLRVIGAPAPRIPGVEVESLPWREDTEVRDLAALDIGLMPLDNSEWSEGKCALKLLQYMAMGLPSVSSPRGSVREIVADGHNGFVADTDDEWREKLGGLIGDAEKRRMMGSAARHWVEENYNLNRYGPILVDHLRRAIDGDA